MMQATGLSLRHSLRLTENGAAIGSVFLGVFFAPPSPAMIPTHTSSSADGEDAKWGRGRKGPGVAAFLHGRRQIARKTREQSFREKLTHRSKQLNEAFEVPVLWWMM